jgi:DNA repair exonuclease SbcCD nuclease subunit
MYDTCLVTDTHFGHDKNSEVTLDSSMNFFTKQLIPYLKKHKIKRICILGDVFDNRTAIGTKTHDAVYKLFDVHLKDFEVFVIIGNHDIFYNSTIDVHSLQFLYKFDNVRVIDKPTIEQVGERKILFLPWMVDEESMTTALDQNPADILMGHFDLKGFYYNKHVLSRGHKSMSSDNFIGRFRKVYSGHFHTRSTKTIADTEITYVGTPYHLNRSDIDEERGFLLLDTQTYKQEWITNTVSCRFGRIEYPEKLSKKLVYNNRIDLYITYTRDDYSPDEYEKYIDKLNKYEPASVNINYIKESKLESDFDIKKHSMSSIPDLFRTYLETLKDIKYKDEILDVLDSSYKHVKGE